MRGDPFDLHRVAARVSAPSPHPFRAVTPIDAASLVIARGADAEVLIGRRRPSASFVPGVYVFPGGRVDRADALAPPGVRLRPEVERKLTRRRRSTPAHALAVAAIRETHEETGLLLATPGDGLGAERLPDTPMWRAFAAAGATPALGALDYIARAITPAESPRRFNTRFFIADARHVRGVLKRDGELLDLHWVPLRDAGRRLDLMDVTEFVLARVAEHLARTPRERAECPVPVLCYVNGVGRILDE